MSVSDPQPSSRGGKSKKAESADQAASVFRMPPMPPKVVLNEQEAESFDWLMREMVYVGPEGQTRMRAFARLVTGLYAEARAKVAAWPLQRLTNEALVRLLRAHYRTRENAFKFLAALGGPWAYSRDAHKKLPEMVATDIPVPDPEAEGDVIRVMTFPRRWSYLNLLHLADQHPPALLQNDLLLHAAWRAVIRECEPRLRRQPAGLVTYGMELAKELPLSPGADETIEAGLSVLRKFTWKRVPRLVWETLLGRPPLDESDFDEQKGELNVQAWLTLMERTTGKDRFGVLLDALDGNYNILPRAIADDLLDQARKLGHEPMNGAEEISVVIEEVEPLSDPRVNLDTAELLRSVRESHPDLAPAIDSALGEGKDTITPRAVASRLEKLRKALGAPARGKGRPRTRRPRRGTRQRHR